MSNDFCQIEINQNVYGNILKKYAPIQEQKYNRDEAVIHELVGDLAVNSYHIYTTIHASRWSHEKLEWEIKEIVPEMFAETAIAGSRQTPEYLAERISQVIDMILVEFPAILPDWNYFKKGGTKVHLKIEYKWIMVEIESNNQSRSLCMVYWSDDDMKFAKEHLRIELPEAAIWLERFHKDARDATNRMYGYA